MNQLGIDVHTKDAKRLIAKLKTLKTTMCVEDGGMYREDPTYSRVWLTTSWTEQGLDNWLYNTKHGCEYVGVFAATC